MVARTLAAHALRRRRRWRSPRRPRAPRPRARAPPPAAVRRRLPRPRPEAVRHAGLAGGRRRGQDRRPSRSWSTPGPGGALINGHRAGELQVIVPLGWTVQWDWRSADSTAPHSLVVMEEREKLPTEGGRAAFTNAMTKAVTAGLAAGQVDRTTFTADQAGLVLASLWCAGPRAGRRVHRSAGRSRGQDGRSQAKVVVSPPSPARRRSISCSNSRISRPCCAPVAGP